MDHHTKRNSVTVYYTRWVFTNVHINLHSVQKVAGGKGKWLKKTIPNKSNTIFKKKYLQGEKNIISEGGGI